MRQPQPSAAPIGEPWVSTILGAAEVERDRGRHKSASAEGETS
jgi:hypothetical protein